VANSTTPKRGVVDLIEALSASVAAAGNAPTPAKTPAKTAAKKATKKASPKFTPVKKAPAAKVARRKAS
jgi:hypothetical protein